MVDANMSKQSNCFFTFEWNNEIFHALFNSFNVEGFKLSPLFMLTAMIKNVKRQVIIIYLT